MVAAASALIANRTTVRRQGFAVGGAESQGVALGWG